MSILDTIRRLLGRTGTKYISREVMKEMLLSGEYYTIHTSKKNGQRIKRPVYAVEGPTGNVDYDYAAKGYMIFFDEKRNEYRTFILRNIWKIVDDNGQEYLIR